MAETIRIEIPIEAIDNTDPELSKVVKKLTDMKDSADSANNAAKKAGETVSKFDRVAENTQKTLSAWAKEKYEILLEAKDKISPLLSTIGSGLRSLGSRTWNVTMKAVDLITAPVKGIIDLLRNPVFQVGAVLGVSFGLADTISTYKDFEAAMSQVQAISGATSSQLDRLTAKAKEMGSTTKFTATESAEAFNYMAMAGWKTEDMLNGIEGILSLAAASGEDLATTSDIVTDALTAFNMKASEAGMFSDVLAAAASNANTTVSGMGETFKYAGSMAGSLGYTIEDVALMTGLMANTGIKATMAGTSLNSIFTRLSTNTGGAADAMYELGISFFTSEGNARDLSDVMEELRDATRNMSAEQKSQLANTIAGTQAQKGLLAILNASEEDYNKLAYAINNADGAAAQMSETMLDNLQGSITLLQSAVDGAKISFGERLSPYVRSLAGWLTDQIPVLEKGLDELMDWVDSKVDRMKRKLDEIAGTEEWQNANFFGKVHILWDEFIAEPFSEWWNTTGKEKVSAVARNIGEAIGTGLRVGTMALLGIDISETLDEGAALGSSFARGFSEGFDFESISDKLWKGFGNLFSNAGRLLPGGQPADLSSIFSAVMLGKIASPFISIGKGAFGIGKTLFGLSGGGTSLIGSLLGNSVLTEAIDGSTIAGGTGLLGLFGRAGLALGSGATSGTGLALAGGGAIAGGLAGGATLISGGIDLYKALKSDNKEEATAYGESAAWKAGGVAAGAAAGAAIGSVIPGLGTAVGALIGAGVGGISGWIKGNKVKEEYEENLQAAQEAAEQAQKVFDVTGLSIDDINFANKDLQEAMHDTELSASQLAVYLQEDMARVANEAFGDIKLSLSEIKVLAEKITFGDMKEGLEEFNSALASTENSLAVLKDSMSAMKKENWRVGLGMELSESEQYNYRQSIDNFVQAAQSYINERHYEATVALNLLTGVPGDTTGIDSYYNDLKAQVDEINERLAETVDRALEDGVISTEAPVFLDSNKIKILLPDGTLQLSEADEIASLQNQIAEITSKLSEAEVEASFQALGIKYSGSGLTAESWAAMQQELAADMESMTATYDNALKVTLTDLNLRLETGDISEEEYAALLEKAESDYLKQVSAANDRVMDFNLNTIAEAYEGQLNRILPDIEGTTREKLEKAMYNALIINPDVQSWQPEDVKKWLGLDDVETSALENICAMLKETAEMVPKKTLEGVQETGWDDLAEQYDVSGTLMADSLNNSISRGIIDGSDLLRESALAALNEAFADPYHVSASVNITPTFNVEDVPFPWLNVTEHAAGGYVSGGPQLSWLAEEGYGEFVIPTNPSRRTRALELYEQAGAALGVSAYASGGYVGCSNELQNHTDYNLFNGTVKNVTSGYNEDSGYIDSNNDGISVGAQVEEKGGIEIHVQMSPEFVITSSEAQSEDDIMEIIRKNMKAMADELGGEIAERLEAVFSNMPTVKEA